MSRKLLAMVLVLVLASWLLQGCVPSGDKMTPDAASTLQHDVAAAVLAADASRWDAAIDALDQLEADVASAQEAGGLSDQRATQIRAVRQRVIEDLHRIRLSSPTPDPATTIQTTPSTETKDNDDQSGKSKHDDQGENGGGKPKDDDQGENGGGKHKGKDKNEQGQE
jgi:hypothetical protein